MFEALQKRWQCLLCDPQNLAGVNIEVLMGQHIPEAHYPFPVLLRDLFLQCKASEFIELFHGLTQSEILHTDGIQEQTA